ncbi:MAG: NUDIX domain-containing protein [Candidatus Kerfeldbacteria bacterium]|nr:NUDIX domain-containing protein [Candidatus Kerfeldbacteria bacterium]
MPKSLPQVATAILLDRNGDLLIYLRDDKLTIAFPNYWDLFGGQVQEGESPEQALVREIQEELGIYLEGFHKFRVYECLEGDVRPNVKHVYWAKLDVSAEDLTLREGQRLAGVSLEESKNTRFANILSRVVNDFVQWYATEPSHEKSP